MYKQYNLEADNKIIALAFLEGGKTTFFNIWEQQHLCKALLQPCLQSELQLGKGVLYMEHYLHYYIIYIITWASMFLGKKILAFCPFSRNTTESMLDFITEVSELLK